MGKQKRIRIELVPREQPDVALYVRALLLSAAQEQLKSAPVEPPERNDAVRDEPTGAREVPSC